MSDNDYCLKKINLVLQEKGLMCCASESGLKWKVESIDFRAGVTQFFASLNELKEKYLLRPEKIFKYECFCLKILDIEENTLDLNHFKGFAEAASEKNTFEKLYGNKISARIYRVNDKGQFPIAHRNKAALRVV